MTLAEAIADAQRRQTAAQCAAGRHVRGCPHRPLPVAPWARLAVNAQLDGKVLA